MRINPFVPEWRAGDQIAQITERTGTLPMDFIRVEFPQFTYSAIDAIKIESFVNLEFETDFIVAMSKLTLDPLNAFTNNLSNIGSSLTIPDVNLRDTVPGNIDVNIGRQGYVPNKDAIMVALLKKLSFDVLHDFVALNLYISKHSKEEVTVAELKDILTDNISLIRDMHDTKTLAIADILQKAVSYSGENETKFIEDLSNQNTEKFRLIKDYIKGEKMETTILKTEMDNVLRTGTIDKETAPSLVLIGGENIKARSFSTDVIIGDDLKQKILTTNERVLPSLERIRTDGRDAEVKEIEDMGIDIVTGIRTNLDSYARDMKRNESIHRLAYQDTTGKLLGLTSTSSVYSSAVAADSSSTSSSTDSSTASAYNYTGIYILDKNNKQVHLFDYVD
ncbi:hypothetical protein GW830_02335 [bacterium]|nr:hypothetical protein [bacterium]